MDSIFFDARASRPTKPLPPTPISSAMSIRSVSSHGSHGSHGPHHHHHHHHHRDSQSSYRNGSLSRDRSAAYGGAGYASAPPPGVDAQLWQTFNAVDVDHSGSISVSELRNALVNGDWTKFDLDTVKMLMNMFDTDRSGTIGFTEFSGLWNYIKQWQDIFRRFDKDRSGSIEGYELAEALRSFGYNLSPAILTIIEQKYASGTTAEYGPPPGITFDRFVRACVVVKSLTESFQRADTDRDGYIQLNYEQFMRITLSMP